MSTFYGSIYAKTSYVMYIFQFFSIDIFLLFFENLRSRINKHHEAYRSAIVRVCRCMPNITNITVYNAHVLTKR